MTKLLSLYLILIAGNVFSQVKPIDEIFEPVGDFDTKNYTKVAVVQWAPEDDAPLADQLAADKYKQSNIKILEEFITEAARSGAKLILTPEFGIVGYPDIPELPSAEDNFRSRDDIRPYVETVPGPSTQYFSKLSKKLGVYIHFGLAEKDRITNVYYNSVVVVGPTGKIEAKYRKRNLYSLENQFLVAGKEITTYNAPFGKVGLIICADVYDYVTLLEYKKEQVKVLALSTSWAEYNSGWSYFTRAAIENGAYLLASNHDWYPDSGVINPDGSIQSHIRQSSGIAYGQIPN